MPNLSLNLLLDKIELTGRLAAGPGYMAFRARQRHSYRFAIFWKPAVKHSQKIISLEVLDIRYPTVRLGMAGSDPRHLAPNYSCAMPILRTDGGLEGRSLIFTIGDGTQIQAAAVEALRRFVVGRPLDEFIAEARQARDAASGGSGRGMAEPGGCHGGDLA